MQAIVFGATGFLGSHVVEQLALEGHAVVAGVRASSDTTALDRLGVPALRLDFQDVRALERAIAGTDAVFNCIADVRMHKPLETYRATDVAVTRRVAEAAATAGVRRFIQLSTIEVYGYPPVEPPFDEATPCRPEFAYQRAALEREEGVREVAARSGLDVVTLRPASAMGPRNPPLERLVQEHARGRFPVVGTGTVPFSMVDARDVARAMLWLAEAPGVGGKTYLLRAFETSWLGIKAALDELRGAPARLQSLPVPVAAALARVLEWVTPYSREPMLTRFAVRLLTTPHLYDDSRLRAAGFAPRYGLREAIEHLAGTERAAGLSRPISG